MQLAETFTETKEIDIQKLTPSVFPRRGVYFGQYNPMTSDIRVPALFPIGETKDTDFLQKSGGGHPLSLELCDKLADFAIGLLSNPRGVDCRDFVVRPC